MSPPGFGDCGFDPHDALGSVRDQAAVEQLLAGLDVASPCSPVLREPSYAILLRYDSEACQLYTRRRFGLLSRWPRACRSCGEEFRGPEERYVRCPACRALTRTRDWVECGSCGARLSPAARMRGRKLRHRPWCNALGV